MARTSITEARARAIANAKKDQPIASCKIIPGLRLKGLKRPGVASWQYRYSDITGKRRVYSFGKYPAMGCAEAADKALAMDDTDPFAKRRETEAQQRQAHHMAKTRTVSAYLEGPYSLHQSRKKTGDATIKRIRNGFPELLDRDMASLRKADIQAWQHRRETEGRAFSTMQRDLGALQTMLNHATRQDPPVIEVNPLSKVTLERPIDDDRTRALEERRKAARRLLTDDEQAGLFRGLDLFAQQKRDQRQSSRAHGKPYLQDLTGVYCSHWFVPFAWVAFYTGLRPGDIFSLTWRELNVTFARLSKTPEKTRHHPKPAQINMTLAEPLRPVVSEWWEMAGKPTAGLVFPSAKTGRQMDHKAHRKPWRAVRALGKLDDSLQFYALRHHFISTLVSRGIPVFNVARMVGHKSAAMIESNYGHLSPDAGKDAIAVFVGSASNAGQQKTNHA